MRLLAALAAVLLVACAVDPAVAPRDCTPGATAACACPGASGVQTCGDDGRLGACVCADAASAPDVAVVADVVTAPDRPTTADVVDAGAAVDVVAEDRAAADVVDAADAPDVRVCEPRQTCGSDCVADYQTDPRHCGTCFNRCSPRGANSVATCSGGRCVLGCAAGFVPCGADVCVSPSASTFDCAACGFACLAGQRCDYDGRRGRCVPL